MENFGWVYPCGETVSANPYWPTSQCRHWPTMGLRFSPTFKISVKTELEAWIHSLKDWTLSTSDACEWRLTFGRVRIWAPQLIQLGWPKMDYMKDYEFALLLIFVSKTWTGLQPETSRKQFKSYSERFNYQRTEQQGISN